MLSREMAHTLIAEISNYDLYACFRVEGDKLLITGKLAPELSARIKQHKADLIDYLTIPPDVLGICRRGHKVEWICAKHGLWVYACYQLPVEQEPVARSISNIGDYWQRERA